MHKRTSADTTNGIHVRLQNELLRAIESFRRSEPDIPTRPEAVRRLLQQAMKARQEKVASNLHQQGA
jgi:metal-responsive CopG/Arc/MetJ family transcriptional regulator